WSSDVCSSDLIRAGFYKRFKVIDYKISFFTYVLNAFIGRVISIAMVILCIGLFERYALFQIDLTWYWFIYGYIVWEFAHFMYHFLAHKKRIFCGFIWTYLPPNSLIL